MKKLYTLLALLITLITSAQAPQGFNYQATVRNNAGQPLLNQIVLVKFNILQNSASGTVAYSENQTANTDDLGHINLVVGQGTPTTGTLASINWGTGSYYLAIELNGTYYHSDRFKSMDYHLNKTKKCEEKCIKLIHIFENEWIHHQEVVKSLILKSLNFIKFIDFYEIREISIDECYKFLKKYSILYNFHIPTICFGMFSSNE